ncbi:hypothetical protein [Providencia stuartii]|uniref:hypothetical protein n=1 Tax=Providencia stuartii TaxID=588 RepID=UPI00076B611B|nr:hypothetical protein [Providencia stuartii]AMG67613.1 hypothetical protein AL507_14030 [Providencia stuartii]
MENITFKYSIVRFNDKWLYDTSKPFDFLKFISFKGGAMNKKPFLFFIQKKRSVRNDLILSEDELWKGLRKNTRYDINKAKELDIDFESVDLTQKASQKNSQEIIENFIFDYNNFISSKELPIEKLSYSRLFKYRNNIIITKALDKKSSSFLAQHMYFKTNEYAELLYSIVNTSFDNKLTGLANKHLHWNDFILLKSYGVLTYDWGGIAIDGSLPGITNFKLSFGGDDITYNIYNSPLYQLALKLKSL